MRTAILALLACALTVATARALGGMFLRKLNVSVNKSEETTLSFVLGAVFLGLIVLGLAAVGLARKGVFIAFGVIVILIWLRSGRRAPRNNATN